MRLSPDGRDVGRGNPRRSNGQQGERAPLQENFWDWVLRYVCNAAADPKQHVRKHRTRPTLIATATMRTSGAVMIGPRCKGGVIRRPAVA